MAPALVRRKPHICGERRKVKRGPWEVAEGLTIYGDAVSFSSRYYLVSFERYIAIAIFKAVLVLFFF